MKLREIMTKEFLLDCIKKGMTQREIAEYVNRKYNKNITRSSVWYWLRRVGLTHGKMRYIYPELDIDNLLKNSGVVKETLEGIRIFKENIKNTLVEQDYVLHILISDTHAGFVWDRLGYNNYERVLTKRFDKLYNEIVKKIEKMGRPKKIVINLLGDLVDGDNVYPEQHEFVDTVVLHQVKFMIKTLQNFIINLTKYTDVIKVFAVAGNHGKIKTARITNWDNFIYLSLQTIFDILNEEYGINVDVVFSERLLMIYKEEYTGHVFHITHGHLLKKSLLSNIKNLMAELKIRKLTGDVDFDVFLIGHVHQVRFIALNNRQWFISNGTMYDSLHFTHEIGYPCTLSVAAFTSTKEKPVEEMFIINLEDKEYFEREPMVNFSG